jgi:hypothetical protein
MTLMSATEGDDEQEVDEAPRVYELTIPSSHMTSRIAKIVRACVPLVPFTDRKLRLEARG